MLLPPLRKNSEGTHKPSRLTITTSEMHMWTPLHERGASNILKELDKRENFAPSERYSTTKLLNVLWVRQLAPTVDRDEVIINMVNPGLCWTSLHRDDDSAFMWYFKKVFAWTAAQGGYCIADAVFNHDASTHGGYLSEQKPTAYVLSNLSHLLFDWLT